MGELLIQTNRLGYTGEIHGVVREISGSKARCTIKIPKTIRLTSNNSRSTDIDLKYLLTPMLRMDDAFWRSFCAKCYEEQLESPCRCARKRIEKRKEQPRIMDRLSCMTSHERRSKYGY